MICELKHYDMDKTVPKDAEAAAVMVCLRCEIETTVPICGAHGNLIQAMAKVGAGLACADCRGFVSTRTDIELVEL